LINQLNPHRIAFYSYAHVPWKSKGQRRYSEKDLPGASEKWRMYSKGKLLLEQSGFKSIGMDHFALPQDALFTAANDGNLHRNFMGYTTNNSKLLIGLGTSAISDSWNAFVQNEKDIDIYQQKLARGILPLSGCHLLNQEDIVLRQNILELMCRDKTFIDTFSLEENFTGKLFSTLRKLEDDALLVIKENEIEITKKGKPFIRNICTAFDAHLWRKGLTTNTFSKAI